MSGGHLNLARTMATLNDDVLYEIFKYFVAVDINGPFTLIQINKTWQYHIVYNCPNMWTWITIDDFIVDLEQRIAVSLELSKDLPLYITICLPSKHNLLTFQRLFRRCVHIFVEAHASTRMMDKEGTAKIISRILRDEKAPMIKSVQWLTGGSEDKFAFSLLNYHIKTPINLRPVFDVLHPVFISHLDLSQAPKRHAYPDMIPMSQFWKIISLLPFLTSILIDMCALMVELNQNFVTIRAPRLKDLSVIRISATNTGVAEEIFLCLKAPSIFRITLSIAMGDKASFDIAATMSKFMRPKQLILEIGPEFSELSVTKTKVARRYNFGSLESMDITLHATRQDKRTKRDYMQEINSILSETSNLQIFHLKLIDSPKQALLLLKFLHPPLCLLNLTLNFSNWRTNREIIYLNDRGGDYYAPQDDNRMLCAPYGYLRVDFRGYTESLQRQISEDSADEDGRQDVLPQCLKITKLVLHADQESLVQFSEYFDRSPFTVNTLILKGFQCETGVDSSAIGELIQLPQRWRDSLQELDIDNPPLGLTLISKSSYQPFTHLTKLRCQISVAINLLKGANILRLRELILVEPHAHKLELSPLERLTILNHPIQDVAFPNFNIPTTLETLGMEFYPPWPDLLDKVREQAIRQPYFRVKLPGLPHLFILRQLAFALRGDVKVQYTWPTFPSWLEWSNLLFTDSQSPGGCYYCLLSGWTCTKSNNLLFCRRHSCSNLVTITVDTATQS